MNGFEIEYVQRGVTTIVKRIRPYDHASTLIGMLMLLPAVSFIELRSTKRKTVYLRLPRRQIRAFRLMNLVRLRGGK